MFVYRDQRQPIPQRLRCTLISVLFPPPPAELGQEARHSGIATPRHFLWPRFHPVAHIEVMAQRKVFPHRDIIFSLSVCIPEHRRWSLLPFFTPSRTIRNTCAFRQAHPYKKSLTSKNPMMTTSAESMKVSAAEISISLGRLVSAGST